MDLETWGTWDNAGVRIAVLERFVEGKQHLVQCQVQSLRAKAVPAKPHSSSMVPATLVHVLCGARRGLGTATHVNRQKNTQEEGPKQPHLWAAERWTVLLFQQV